MRILIVEDEARIRAFLARAFEAEGFGVDVVGDGEQGLARALTGNYDLVILDLLLPGRSGLEALRELHRECSDLPVLILSARSDLPIKLRSFELGAVDYVAKPFSLDELLARARVQLRRARVAEDNTEIRVGGLALDLVGRPSGPARPAPDGPALPRGAPVGDVRRRELRRDGGLADLGDDPVSLRLDQPDPALRLPGVAAAGDPDRARLRRGLHRSVDHARCVRGSSAVGRAVRGPADVGHVPGHGLARPTSGGRADGGRGRGRGTPRTP